MLAYAKEWRGSGLVVYFIVVAVAFAIGVVRTSCCGGERC